MSRNKALFNANRTFSSLSQNISIAVVGKNEKFHILNDEDIARYVAAVEKRSAPPPDGGDDGGSGAVGGNEPPSIDDIEEPRDLSGDPQVQVAMET